MLKIEIIYKYFYRLNKLYTFVMCNLNYFIIIYKVYIKMSFLFFLVFDNHKPEITGNRNPDKNEMGSNIRIWEIQ